VFCSEDLGAFYLDILKDRLYTTAPASRARRSAQTALWHIAHAMLRWMAPFLSFTAEEAWKVFGPKGSPSIFVETYSAADAWKDEALLARWARIAAVRSEANKRIEALRAEGRLGSSLQAEVTVKAGPKIAELLQSLGDDFRFVLISSAARVEPLATAQTRTSSSSRQRSRRRRSASAAGTTAPTSATTPRIRRSARAAPPISSAPAKRGRSPDGGATNRRAGAVARHRRGGDRHRPDHEGDDRRRRSGSATRAW
jgi:isoleucyl-tRNA synthetase